MVTGTSALTSATEKVAVVTVGMSGAGGGGGVLPPFGGIGCVGGCAGVVLLRDLLSAAKAWVPMVSAVSAVRAVNVAIESVVRLVFCFMMGLLKSAVYAG